MLIEPRADLYDRIINRINHEEKIAILKRRLRLQFSGFIFCFLVFVPLAMGLYADITESGLLQFISLTFTDFNIITANIGDYALTLLESTPVVSLALVSTVLLALVFYVAKLEDSYSDFRKLIIHPVK